MTSLLQSEAELLRRLKTVLSDLDHERCGTARAPETAPAGPAAACVQLAMQARGGRDAAAAESPQKLVATAQPAAARALSL